MKNIRAFWGVLAACFLLILAGCQSPLEQRDTAGNESGSGTLLLSISGQGARRTIMPETILNDFARFRLEFIASCDTANGNYSVSWTRAEITGGFDPAADTISRAVELDPGTWDLYVTAYLDNHDGGEPREAATGILRGIVIPAGGIVDGGVRLYPIPEGMGTFSWHLVFPANLASVGLVFTDAYGADIYGVDAVTFDVPAGATEWACYTELPAGRYQVIFRLVNTYGERAVASEFLHVYQNMESSFSTSFEARHFLATLLSLILEAWDGSQWDFEYAEIEAGHFELLYIQGINTGNFAAIVQWFNQLSTPATVPTDMEEFKALVDAALLGNAGVLAGNFSNWSEAQAAIANLVLNGSAIRFVWTGDHTVNVGIGAYEVEIVFANAVPTGLHVPGITLYEQLAWLRENAQSGNYYRVEINEDQTISPWGNLSLLPTDRTNLTIILTGIVDMRTVGIDATGVLFLIPEGITLVLDKNITLQGCNYHAWPLVQVNDGGNLVMNAGSGITGNLYVGVYVSSGGTFTMHGGEILDNNGGGVHNMGTFNMEGGTISGNTNTWGDGGGVWNSATFTMRGGIISGNTTGGDGGGVHVTSSGSFRISDGVIYGNETTVEESFRNTTEGNGASLSAMGTTTAQRGTFANGVFNSLGSLHTANNTIRVVNGQHVLAGTVNVTGNAVVGRTLTANTSGLSGTGELAFQWMRGTVNIGTNSSDYVVQPEDADSTITVIVTRYGYWGYIASSPTSPILRRGAGDLAISFADFVDLAPGVTIIGPVIRLLGNPEQASTVITVTNPGQYDVGSIRWFLLGTQIIGSMISGYYGETLTLGPRIHNRLLDIGTHLLTVEVDINGIPYSRCISFTVER